MNESVVWPEHQFLYLASLAHQAPFQSSLGLLTGTCPPSLCLPKARASLASQASIRSKVTADRTRNTFSRERRWEGPLRNYSRDTLQLITWGGAQKEDVEMFRGGREESAGERWKLVSLSEPVWRWGQVHILVGRLQ